MHHLGSQKLLEVLGPFGMKFLEATLVKRNLPGHGQVLENVVQSSASQQGKLPPGSKIEYGENLRRYESARHERKLPPGVWSKAAMAANGA